MNYWGRIFFLYEEDCLSRVYGQPLANHMENCLTILDNFAEEFFHPETKQSLRQAVKHHDLGKKSTFRLFLENGNLIYSFSGHRFRVEAADPYVGALIRSHHDFSVDRINQERAMLGAGKLTFADDLYLLCMADQLEAELAVKTVENKDDVPRTFMEFTTKRLSDDRTHFTVVPWPFQESALALQFILKEPMPQESWLSQSNPEKQIKHLENIFKTGADFQTTTKEIYLESKSYDT